MTQSITSDGSKHCPVAELLKVRKQDRDPDWLKQMLQWAVQLEFTTIPLYLCAYWSIDSSGYVSATIYEILKEEMGHFGLACNLLTTIGGTPKINTSDVVPKYPGPLPGGVQPNLKVVLRGLKKDKIPESFMQIEYPQKGPITTLLTDYPTIGDFYDAILGELINQPDATFTGARQLRSVSVGVVPIITKTQAIAAIQKIKIQGEGTTSDPRDQRGVADDLAHYYRFGEIYYGNKLILKEDGSWKYEGDNIPFPDVYDIPDVPEGGYAKSDDFDRLYTVMLGKLQSAWENGDQGLLSQAISDMYGLSDPALELMNTLLPSGTGNYCPDFRLVP